MNIVFWSESQGRCATSGNMLAVSVMSSLIYSVKGIVMQLDNCSRPIDDVFEGKRQTNLIMEEYSYYNQKGIDDLLDKSQLKEIDLSDLKDNVLPIKNTYMGYIPTSKRIKSGLSDRELMSNAKKIMTLMNEVGGYNFIDCVNGDKAVTKKLLSHADMVVINICQGMNVEKLMLSDNIMKKAVFLIGKYDDGSSESVLDICKKYNLNRDRVAAIPYNIKFHDAMNEGSLVPFLSKQISVRRTDNNFAFVNGVYRATDMILRRAGYDETREASRR